MQIQLAKTTNKNGKSYEQNSEIKKNNNYKYYQDK